MRNFRIRKVIGVIDQLSFSVNLEEDKYGYVHDQGMSATPLKENYTPSKRKLWIEQGCHCGWENPPDHPYDEGEKSEPMPWHVWFTEWSNNNNQYTIFCSGVILNTLVILTAAMCVEKYGEFPKDMFLNYPKQRINIPAQSNDKFNIRVQQIIVHPDFLRGDEDMNVATLILSEPLKFNYGRGIRPICLPPIGMKIPFHNDGYFTQFIDEEFERIPTYQFTIAQLLPHHECRRGFSASYDEAKYICGGSDPENATSLQGGELSRKTVDGSHFLIGIFSNVHLDSKINFKTWHTLFFKVENFLEFLENISKTVTAHQCIKPKKFEPEILSRANPPLMQYPWKHDLIASRHRKVDEGCVCGYQREDQKNARVMGGQVASIKNHPWIVRFGDFRCGGSIINDRMIITAAHCLVKQNLGNDEVLKLLESTAGHLPTVRIYADRNDTGSIIKVENFVIHPRYLKLRMEAVLGSDIAILKLSEPLSFVRPDGPVPVCLPDFDDEIDLTGSTLKVVGWGRSNRDQKLLHEAELPVWPLQRCQERSVLEVLDTVLCATTFNSTKGSKKGDSGGPLLHQMKSHQYMQMALVSWDDAYIRNRRFGLNDNFFVSVATNISDFINYYGNKFGAKWCKRLSSHRSYPHMPWREIREISGRTFAKCRCGENILFDENGLAPPWLAFIKINARYAEIDHHLQEYCTGSLINSKFVLTSASCVRTRFTVKSHQSPTIHPNGIQVFLGLNTTSMDNPLRVRSVRLHPDYIYDTSRLDFAMLELENDIDLENYDSTGISPICFPSALQIESLKNQLFQNSESKLKMSGWKSRSKKNVVRREFKVFTLSLSPSGDCLPLRITTQSSFICLNRESVPDPNQSFGGAPLSILSQDASFLIGIYPYTFSYQFNRSQGFFEAAKHNKDTLIVAKKIHSGKDDFAFLLSDVEHLRFVEYFSKQAGAKWCL